MTIDQLVQSRIGVLGWSVNNRSVTHWLVRHGADRVMILDEKIQAGESIEGIHDWRTGANAFQNLGDFDVLLRTPGIPLERPEIQAAIQAGVTVTSQTRLFFEFCPAPIIGVTGTKGKGTTSALTHAMLRHACQEQGSGHAYLAGNIGRDPFEFLDEVTADDWVVLELSSFQLEDADRSPHVAVVLTVSEDHLDRHGTIETYRQAKQSIVQFQSSNDHVVVHADDVVSQSFAELSPGQRHEYSRTKSVTTGACIQEYEGERWIVRSRQHIVEQIVPVSQVQLRGEHNLENVTAASAAASAVGVSVSSIAQAIREFSGLPHRLEYIATVNDVTYYNDSYATGPLPAKVAVEAFNEPIVLILGGKGKGADYTPLIDAIAQSSVKAVVGYGVEGETFLTLLNRTALPIQLVREPEFDQAVMTASALAESGDVVLLSPSATSYDQFPNYTARGERFREIVQGLTHGA